jgi:hypothetical protein
MGASEIGRCLFVFVGEFDCLLCISGDRFMAIMPAIEQSFVPFVLCNVDAKL